MKASSKVMIKTESKSPKAKDRNNLSSDSGVFDEVNRSEIKVEPCQNEKAENDSQAVDTGQQSSIRPLSNSAQSQNEDFQYAKDQFNKNRKIIIKNIPPANYQVSFLVDLCTRSSHSAV